HASGAVARRPLFPFGARAVTALHHGLLRSAVTGEADAILTRAPARDLGMHVVADSRLRRIAHAVEVEGVTVLNFHIDGDRAQLDRVVALARGRSIIAGDANLVAAGAAGPLPRAAVDAAWVRLERDLAEGRSGKAYIEELVEQRERIRGAIAAGLGTTPDLVALADSTSRGCEIVIAGLGLSKDDEI